MNELKVGKKIVIGETLANSSYYKKGEVFTIDFVFEIELGVVLDNGMVILETEIDWEKTNMINGGL